MKVKVFGATDVGLKRENNEDAYFIASESEYAGLIEERGLLIIVADGMGGHNSGEVASKMAVENISKFFYTSDIEGPLDRLVASIKEANKRIYEKAATSIKLEDMGTTVVAGVILGNKCYIANAGDSRCYLIREGKIKQITQDDSLVAELVRKGIMTEEEAEKSPQRNVITKSVGNKVTVEPSSYERDLAPNDYLLFCTDGLSGVIDSEEILKAVESTSSLKESVEKMIRLVKERGAPDNVTIVLANFIGAEEKPRIKRLVHKKSSEEIKPLSSNHSRIVLSVAGILLIVLSAFAGFYYIKKLNNLAEKMFDRNEKEIATILELRNGMKNDEIKINNDEIKINNLKQLIKSIKNLHSGKIYQVNDNVVVKLNNGFSMLSKNKQIVFFPSIKYSELNKTLPKYAKLVSSADGIYYTDEKGNLYNLTKEDKSPKKIKDNDDGNTFCSVLKHTNDSYYILEKKSGKYTLYEHTINSEATQKPGNNTPNEDDNTKKADNPISGIFPKETPITCAGLFSDLDNANTPAKKFYVWYLTKEYLTKDTNEQLITLHIKEINTANKDQIVSLPLPNWCNYYIYGITNNQIMMLIKPENLTINQKPVVIDSKITEEEGDNQ